jgi:hypothetical protein
VEADAGRREGGEGGGGGGPQAMGFESAACFLFSQFFSAQQLAATFKVPIASSSDAGAAQQEADSILPKKLTSM